MIQFMLQLLLIVFPLGEPVVENENLVKDYIECHEALTKNCTVAFNEC
ncbi:hypothetical protein [Salegentibacter salegens]|uniref:Uncharacterized protein n=1 Tax=Salegentibacter salegens TaxID=143223 RepID=A0A1M7JP86_9FLAO|nr:hypothetical protein [Salegentibacter salegens]PRX51870.1 hypothetical protein LY58_00456 [Salegentibacter salegens]SHM54357.1 hypothetical protein SAMN05878281_1045 [Salegentibacter salegens]